MSKPFKELREALKTLDLPTLDAAGRLIIDAVRRGGKVIVMGNGGSATDADHLAAEMVVRFKPSSTRPPLPCIALTNPAILTAAGNDFGYGESLAQQIRAYEKEGDVVIAISTSGASDNVNTAVQNVLFSPVIYLTGAKKIKHLTRQDVVVNVGSDSTGVVQECHRAIIHYWCEMLEKEFEDASK